MKKNSTYILMLSFLLFTVGCTKSGEEKKEDNSNSAVTVKERLLATKWNMLFNGQSYGTIIFNDNGTCKKTADGAYLETEGTWKYENENLTLSFPSEGEPFTGTVKVDGENLIVKFMDGAIIYTYTPAQIGESIKGKIISVEDTGLGPFEGITIEDENNGNKVYFMVEVGKFNSKSPDGKLLNKYVTARYKVNDVIRITDLMLRSEYEKAAAQAHVYIAGKYLSGEIGDMGSYITILDSDGKEVQYQGTFEVDAANVDKYKGKKVILYYEETTEYELLDLIVNSK